MIPFPPRGGNLQRSFNLIREASHSHEISLVALNVDGVGPASLSEYTRELEQYCREVTIWTAPYPWKGLRWQMELLQSAASRAPFSCRARYSRKLNHQWKEKLARHQGSLVHFDSIDLAFFVPATDGFRRVLNHHNCESVLAFRRAETEQSLFTRGYLQLEARKLARWEYELLGRFEVNTAVCEEDRQRLLAVNPAAHIHVVENGVDTTYFQPYGDSEEPQSVIFTASLNWAPNASAAIFFAKEIWPLVKRQSANAKLYIAGREPPRSVLQLALAGPSVVVFQNPDDIRPLIARASVYICPIREGAGTRLKILDAMAMGKAVVSTRIGCEGLRVRPGEDILIADAPHDFANAILNLFADKSRRRRLGSAGRELVEREYAWKRIGHQLEEAYRCANGTLECAGRL